MILSTSDNFSSSKTYFRLPKIIAHRNIRKLFAVCLVICLYSCKKEKGEFFPETVSISKGYTVYTILENKHYCDKNNFRNFNGTGISFKVKFDSTAIYQTKNPGNQNDINKLYGFAEGTNHHLHSARIGWAWYRNTLKLYAYVYSDSTRSIKEITPVEIGEELSCNIKIANDQYLFSVNGIHAALDRKFIGPPLPGYWLYPYFGGDEVAPHTIIISILDIKS